MKKSIEQRIGGPNSVESLKQAGFCISGNWSHIKVAEVRVGEDTTALMRVRATIDLLENQTILTPFKKDRAPFAGQDIRFIRPTGHANIDDMTTVFAGKSVVKVAQDHLAQIAEEREVVRQAMIQKQNDEINKLLEDFDPTSASTDENLEFAERYGSIGGVIFEQAREVVAQAEEVQRKEFVDNMNA